MTAATPALTASLLELCACGPTVSHRGWFPCRRDVPWKTSPKTDRAGQRAGDNSDEGTFLLRIWGSKGRKTLGRWSGKQRPGRTFGGGQGRPLYRSPWLGGLGIGLFEVVGSQFSGLFGGTRRAGLGLICFF